MVMKEQIRRASLTTHHTKTKAQQNYVNETLAYQEKFRQQARYAQENISIIRDQYRKVHEVYKRKTTEMKERLKVETNKVDRNEQRCRLELEGFASDLASMKRKIEFYHKYIFKLKNLVEEDRGVAGLFKNGRPQTADTDDLHTVVDNEYRVEDYEEPR